MAKRDVVWTATAILLRREILLYWQQRNQSKTYSQKLIRLFATQIKIIQKFPALGKQTDFPNTRESAMEHYSVFYQITDTTIIITAIWDNRQNPAKLLLLLTPTKNR